MKDKYCAAFCEGFSNLIKKLKIDFRPTVLLLHYKKWHGEYTKLMALWDFSRMKQVWHQMNHSKQLTKIKKRRYKQKKLFKDHKKSIKSVSGNRFCFNRRTWKTQKSCYFHFFTIKNFQRAHWTSRNGSSTNFINYTKETLWIFGFHSLWNSKCNRLTNETSLEVYSTVFKTNEQNKNFPIFTPGH